MDGSPVLLVKCVDVGSSGQQQSHHLTSKAHELLMVFQVPQSNVHKEPTSTCPLKAAWCRAVRPARSDTFTLLSNGTKASAQRTALLLAATWSGVCQFLSRALTSALCFSNTATASWEKKKKTDPAQFLHTFKRDEAFQQTLKQRASETCYLATRSNGSVQRCQPLVVFGVNPGSWRGRRRKKTQE